MEEEYCCNNLLPKFWGWPFQTHPFLCLWESWASFLECCTWKNLKEEKRTVSAAVWSGVMVIPDSAELFMKFNETKTLCIASSFQSHVVNRANPPPNALVHPKCHLVLLVPATSRCHWYVHAPQSSVVQQFQAG